MKIAVTATGASLDAQVDPRFGRCPYFIVVDTTTMMTDCIENTAPLSGGVAGIHASELMKEHGVMSVLTGNCGPRAYNALKQANIELIVGCCGTIRDVVRRFESGRLNVPLSNKDASGAPAHESGHELQHLMRQAEDLRNELSGIEERLGKLARHGQLP